MNKTPRKTDNNSAGKECNQPDAKALAVSVLRNTCIWFTVLSLCILLVTLLSSAIDDTSSSAYLRVSRFLLLLPFAFCAALAGEVRRSSLPPAARGMLHPCISLGGFILFVYLPVNLEQAHTPAKTLLWILAILVVYLVGLFIYLGVRRTRNRKKAADTPYQSQFRPRQ